ncbi:transmembrane 4 L6 family member 1-like isoform X1 [Pelobates cultripes]|uniref:Transmembrane 4 L6 family member 1-like isoform X1 n=1 Tax=Pelobates cultripes TaxID=61616 RepID=A0AAD1RD73_PELCU|nr:transmembrane 4 L6 family member 1-like isoform X1 [Pelobates cultripes]
MCFGKCAKCIGYHLLILAILCIVANILLYFPNGETKYAENNQLSRFVWFFEGIIGAGVLMFLPAGVFIGLEDDDCCGCCGHERCGKSCAMLSSILAAIIGIATSGYCLIISALALVEGPYCLTRDGVWKYPFNETNYSYLADHKNKQMMVMSSIVVNILLYFPNGDSTYAANNQLTNYVWYFEGICFGGIMMLIVATVVLLVDYYQCCTLSCAGNERQKVNCSELEGIIQEKGCKKQSIGIQSLGSPVFAILGVMFAGYSLIISSLGLVQGPYCQTATGWTYPFQNTAGGYLTEFSTWSQCLEPAYVVEWNVILFSILIVLSGLQIILCLYKAIYDINTICCGTHSVMIQTEDI